MAAPDAACRPRPVDPEVRLCLNCDNRHGCRSARPICLGLDPDETERHLAGRELMRRRGLMELCGLCGHFRQCWSEERYRRALAAS